MIKKIRMGVFETNSSNTHSITIVSKDEFEKWKEGDLFLLGENLVNEEEVHKEYEENQKKYYDTYKEWLEESGELETYNEWEEDEYLETYEESYTSSSGDELVVFGKYGRDS